MNLRLIVGALGFVLMFVALVFLPHPSLEGTVLKVVDGDTFTVMQNGQPVKYRAIGIDTPETKHPEKGVECYGPEATKFAQRFLAGRKVTIVPDSTQDSQDRYGRRLAYLEVDGKDYGLAAVTAGVAREKTYDGKYQRQTRYRLAQTYAQLANKGLWKECGR